jgi:hypothetical protein
LIPGYAELPCVWASKGRGADIKIADLDQSTEKQIILSMKLPDNLPMPTNSMVILAVLCLFIFGGMALAKFMQRRKRSIRGD